MKPRILITLIFAIFTYPSYAQDNAHVDFRSKLLECRGIKKITERQGSGWKAIYLFDREGYMLQENHARKREMRSDYRFDYAVTDTLIEIRRTNSVVFDNDFDPMRIDRHHYDSSDQYYKHNVYFNNTDNLYDSIDDFVYEAGVLVSYTDFLGGKNILRYNENKQMESRLDIHEYRDHSVDTTFFYYAYNRHGQQTDFIQEDDDDNVFYGGIPSWSRTRQNKIHIRYSNFDKHGNWTRSYYITEKHRYFRSKRKIEYW